MLTFWDRTSALTFPNGETKSAQEVMASEDFGFTKTGPAVIATSRGITTQIHSFGVLCHNYEVPEALSDEEALAVINDKIQAEQEEAMNHVSAEERIAAMLEFQAMMALDEA